MIRSRRKTLATICCVLCSVSAFAAAVVWPYASARQEVTDFAFEGGRWRNTVTYSVRFAPIREWSLGDLIGCGPNGGVTVHMFGPLQLERSTWNTQLSGPKPKGTPAW